MNKSNAPERHPLARIEAALDRFQEAHYWIHMLEENYHHADPFRWYLNAFLKSIKEVPQLIQMGLQNKRGFHVWFKQERIKLTEDPLMSFLADKRDFIVHRGMLVPNSHSFIGITEGRGMKMGFTFPVHPLEDSDHAMTRYLHLVAKKKDILGILRLDEDSLPCVHRVWRMPPFDEELIDIAARAWLRTGETINATVTWMGEPPQALSLDCRHTGQQVQYKLFERKKLNDELKVIRKQNPTRQRRKSQV